MLQCEKLREAVTEPVSKRFSAKNRIVRQTCAKSEKRGVLEDRKGKTKPLIFLGKSRVFRWSYWPDLNRRPADYERSSGLPLAGKQRFLDLSAGAFERFDRPIMVFAPLSPQQFFLFWVSVWVKGKIARYPLP